MLTVEHCAFCALLIALLVFSYPALAADPGGPALSAPLATEIITDQERGTVTIVIDGKPAMRIDANGLQVVGDITYSGVLTDAGRENAKKAITGGTDAP